MCNVLIGSYAGKKTACVYLPDNFNVPKGDTQLTYFW